MGWIDLFVNDTIMIENGETFEFLHNLNVANVSIENRIQLIVSPIHHPEDEKGIRWNDPDIGIEWPERKPILSEKDRNLSLLKKFHQLSGA